MNYGPPAGTTLAATGMALTATQIATFVVLGLALVAAGICLAKFAPRRDRS